jgi:hypothetical protein
MSRLLHLVPLLALAGCLRATTFTCETNTECGTGGQCELAAGGYCSFADSSCTASGRRFGDSSGPSSGKCVGETGGPDAPPIDAPPTPMGCPANYMTLPNSGPRGHRYLLVNATATWTQQRDACAGMMTFLAFPDGATPADAQAELDAITTLAGNNAWVGINDLITEGVYKTSLNQTVSVNTRALIDIVGNPQNADCLTTNGATMTDDDCTTPHTAVCECVP